MNLTWTLIRATGLVAYAALALATVWGLLVSTGVLPRTIGKKGLTLVHESLSVAGLIATVGHMVALYLDDFIDFGIDALLVPGRSSWRPFAVALGIVGLYGAVLVTASFYVRDKIGQTYWRTLHYLAFGVFVGITLHGILAGTDRGQPLVVGMYVAASTLVVVLTALRVIQTAADTSKGSPRGRARPKAPATGGTGAEAVLGEQTFEGAA